MAKNDIFLRDWVRSTDLTVKYSCTYYQELNHAALWF